VLVNCRGWHPKKRVSVLEKCPGWQTKLASVCRRRVEGRTEKKVFNILGKYPGLQPKIVVRVHAKCQGWHSRKCVIFLEKCPAWQQKMSTLSRGRVERVTLKMCQFAREGSRVATKNIVSVQAKCRWWDRKKGASFLEKTPGCQPKFLSLCLRNIEGGIQKLRHCHRDVSRVSAQKWRQFAGEGLTVAPKNYCSALGNCRGWHAKNGVSVQAKYQGWHPKKRIVILENCSGRWTKPGVSMHSKCRGWDPKVCGSVLE
jgi:hypothetical protein